MNNKKILLAYRENDLFNAYIPGLGIKATDEIIFPRETSVEAIEDRMHSIGTYDTIICDYTVYSSHVHDSCSELKIIDSTFNRVFNDIFNVGDTEEGFLQAFKKLLSILNSDKKPIVLVKKNFCDHLFHLGDWFNTKFACYRRSEENPSVLEHFIPKEGYKEWKESEEWKELKEEFESQGHRLSPVECKKMSIDLIIEFLQDSLNLNARIVEDVSEVRDGEFMIVDRHVFTGSKPKTTNLMMLPIETAVEYARQGGIVDVEKTKVQEALENALEKYR